MHFKIHIFDKPMLLKVPISEILSSLPTRWEPKVTAVLAKNLKTPPL